MSVPLRGHRSPYHLASMPALIGGGLRARPGEISTAHNGVLGLSNVHTNAQAHGPVLEDIARADGTGLALLRDAADSMRLSARGYFRVLRVARTLTDLDAAEKLGRV